ncbi:class III extradiol dioxygenase subunit B-like domain-containing protein [Streptomyces sp. 71268]|uniref:class III extradiol dioxygenase subunit B-like domain-containing protein n=1 Tax=Streptomyces sp. 71268 TaxID=3002640 RepID=UPI0023F8AE44|nr:class III extradiol dioxygenase subunit B-like domain-containing protein [Streptomyces sp. 71268]WEV24995.1 class III extradiol dioxygenase subunit B-like domain-containing protein [Streptomyces sp. 71268]
MLVAAAVCPCPPLLVPEIAAGAAPELAPLRDACSDAISVLAAARPDRLIVLGPAAPDADGTYPSGSAGSFRGYGVDVTVRLGARPGADGATGHGATGQGVTGHGARSAEADDAEHGANPEYGADPEYGAGWAERELPSSLAIAAWLLERARWSAAPVEGLGLAETLAVDRCTALGRELARSADRVALLISGDGSARRTLKAPGYLDERAAACDAEVARALGTADTTALSELDPHLAQDLLMSGRACWQVLAGAGDGAGLRGALLYDEAPYGVGYFVATWS